MDEKSQKTLDNSYSAVENFSIKTKNKKPENEKSKSWLVLLIVGILGILGGAGCALAGIFYPHEEVAGLTFPKIPAENDHNNIYSKLTGEVLADESQINAPAYCIQTPNGMDGARPQAGLTEAGVIFEAIAEAGITRFAAIYQNPSSAVIGPIRSLRMYYLEWDTPFDCTIVHAGGASDALAALNSGGYKDLTENYAYMYRGTYGNRLWNNLFTTASDLKKFSEDNGYTSSDIKGFARLTPDESEKARVDGLAEAKLDITSPTDGNTAKLVAEVSDINIRFGGMPNFNVNYTYDINSNTYLRSYESGARQDVYECPAENLGERNPEDVCTLTQVAPSVVIAMIVNERRASDNYHEDITAVGSGDAYVFQNGTVIKGTWRKNTRADQIQFFDTAGNEVKLAPGQTFISAVPTYGSVDY